MANAPIEVRATAPMMMRFALCMVVWNPGVEFAPACGALRVALGGKATPGPHFFGARPKALSGYIAERWAVSGVIAVDGMAMVILAAFRDVAGFRDGWWWHRKAGFGIATRRWVYRDSAG